LALFRPALLIQPSENNTILASLIQGIQRHSLILLDALYDIFQHKIFYIRIIPALNDIALFNDLLQNFMSVVCQGLKLISLRGCFFSCLLTAPLHCADNAFHITPVTRKLVPYMMQKKQWV
jgi:hypothetical protein